MRAYLLGVGFLSLLAGCSSDWDQSARQHAQSGHVTAATGLAQPAPVVPARAPAEVAALPDRGQLVAYDRGRPSVARGAYTWHPVQLSEEHALRAAFNGELVVTAPNGRSIRLRHVRHVEHPDGNWTWVGRESGSAPGTEAIITFGEKAVFGSIPSGDEEPMRLMMAAGQAWLVETDRAAIARMQGSGTRPSEPDFLVPPRLGSAPTQPNVASAQATTVGAATAILSTVDVVLGYTSGFATRLGGQSQALTRLTYLVDVTNQAYANSQVGAQLRLVRALQVSYSDATSNQQALYDLTGVACTQQTNGNLSCTNVGVPAALQPLHTARNQYGGDLVSLVRNFNDPENGGCGIAWLNGAGNEVVTTQHENSGLSVVSDSSGNLYPDNQYICRDETLAHELGHNMGSQHDRDTADGSDNVLQQNEYGAFPYSFGYKTAAGTGNFFTVMAYGDSGQTRYRVFSNPRINYCGGLACGVTNAADNATSLTNIIPIVAGFRASASTVVVRGSGDFDKDGKADVLWRNSQTGANVLWKGAIPGQSLTAVSKDWQVVGACDIGGDGRSDILWRNFATGANAVWHSANSTTSNNLTTLTSSSWSLDAVGDFDGDGRCDLIWRNTSTGANVIWKAGVPGQALTSVTDQNWKIVGAGDFNGDGKSDLLWRNSSTGGNVLWRSASAVTAQSLSTVADPAWRIIGAGDFDGDLKSDVLWRNATTGANSIWRSATVGQSLSTVADQNWQVAGLGDYDGDRRTDILWRNAVTGENRTWNSGSSSSQRSLATVTDPAWRVEP